MKISVYLNEISMLRIIMMFQLLLFLKKKFKRTVTFPVKSKMITILIIQYLISHELSSQDPDKIIVDDFVVPPKPDENNEFFELDEGENIKIKKLDIKNALKVMVKKKKYLLQKLETKNQQKK